MKKTLLTILASLALTGAYAQVENANRLILHTKEGKTVVYNLSEMDYMDFDCVEDVTLALTLNESTLSSEAFTVNVVPGAGTASYTVTLAQGENVIRDGGTFTDSADIPFSDLAEGARYTVTATPYDIYGMPGVAASIDVTTVSLSNDPKVGDYFYSDGTWSDGGLISIDPDGQNAVWAAEKPEPIAGKTVVGIVFNTNPDRIAEADKAAGYTHGYVIGCKNATDPNKFNYANYPESIWFAPYGVTVTTNSAIKVGKTWYNNLDGRAETQAILDKYASSPATSVPMFYYCTTGYPVAAPENTSGWFVPSTGQLWDCIANFCSGKVAKALSENRTLAYDFTAYFSEKTGEPVMANFLAPFAKVPAADKDDIPMNDADRAPKSVAMRTSSRYDSETADHFNLGTDENGLIEGMCGWFDEEGHARPILAF